MLAKKLSEFCSAQQNESFYIYDLEALRDRAKAFKNLFPSYFHLHFAVKSNFHPRILSAIHGQGYGADVVSAGEVDRAIESGIPASEIIFSGVGKTVAELTSALKKGVIQINVESEPELERLSVLAEQLAMTVQVSLRVNPNVDAKTHPYIRTGLLENKFGIDFESAAKILNSKNFSDKIIFQGLTMHIGSQIQETAPFFEAAQKVIELYQSCRKTVPSLKVLDFGGGLGIDYSTGDVVEEIRRSEEYAAGLVKLVRPLVESGQVNKVYLEPGRFVVARCGYLLSRIQYVKKTANKNFVIVDTGMHHLMRPSLYKAFHRIGTLQQFAGQMGTAEADVFEVVGPICESSDVIGQARQLPRSIQAGEWLVIHDVGAYGAVMASNYNLRSAAPEYFYNKGTIE